MRSRSPRSTDFRCTSPSWCIETKDHRKSEFVKWCKLFSQKNPGQFCIFRHLCSFAAESPVLKKAEVVVWVGGGEVIVFSKHVGSPKPLKKWSLHRRVFGKCWISTLLSPCPVGTAYAPPSFYLPRQRSCHMGKPRSRPTRRTSVTEEAAARAEAPLIHLPHGPWWWMFSRLVVSDSFRPHGQQHAKPPCRSPSPGLCLSSCSLRQ